MIDLKDIKQGDDVRHYPWQRLINAVRRACNITVAPPLEMHQSYAGTVIGLNVGAVSVALSQYPNLPAVPCYAVRNNGSQTATKNTTSTVTLDTQIHRYPDDATNFTLAGSEVTVVEQKVVSLKWSIYFTVVSSNIAGAVWLEDNTTLIKGTLTPYLVGPGGLGQINGTIDHVMLAANAEIRMRISETLNGDNVTIWGDDTNGYARLDIAVMRDP